MQLPIRLSDAVACAQLEQILTYFIRSKHNDWSAEWIEKHIEPAPLDKYPAFRGDLIRLCKSHHFDREELAREEYRPKQIGVSEHPITVHLRYLACVLRVADILDFDPERTPDVIYKHRRVAAASRIYWYQTFEINAALSSDRRRYVFEARPSDATLHQALRLVAADINRELQLCRRLDESHPFQYSVSGPVPHTWDFPSELTVSIMPRDNAYEFIEGAFRPNTAKLLQILSGTNLYRSELDAIRELLQNAFDAVKETIAYEIVRGQINSTSPDLISASMEVEVRIEESDGRIFVVCADTGVGMTKKIIENYVLVSGNSRSKELRWLERQLEKQGLRLGRTGVFGIGLLSYFMLADQLTVTTRRSQLCGDEDQSGWVFETEGIGSFGELRPQVHRLRGTEVRLRIRETLAKSAAQLEKQVAEYLGNVLVRIPCNLRLVGPQTNLNWKPGRVRNVEDFSSLILKDVISKEHTAIEGKLLSKESREKRLRRAEILRQVETQIKASLRWKIVEGELINGMGFYRVHLPYFELQGGDCLAFLWLNENEGTRVIKNVGKGHYLEINGATVQSWNGMLYLMGRAEYDGHFVEVDWTSPEAGQISVDRWNVRANKGSVSALSDLKQKLRRELRDFVVANKNSAFAQLNARLTDIPNFIDNPQWIRTEEGKQCWLPVPFPNTIRNDAATNKLIGDQRLHFIPLMRSYSADYDWQGLAWAQWGTDPDRILVMPRFQGFELIPVFDLPPKISSVPYCVSTFPPAWNNVMGVYGDFYGYSQGITIWNRSNPLVNKFSSASWRAVREIFSVEDETGSRDINPLSHRDQLLNDEGFLANFIGKVVSGAHLDLWSGLLEKDTSLRDSVRSLLESGGIQEHYFCGQYSWLRLLPSSLEKVEGSTEMRKRLAKPPEGWMVKDEAQPRPLRGLRSAPDPWA